MKQVTIYGTTHCSKCVITKQLLSAKEIPFEFINLDDRQDIMENIMTKVWPHVSLPIIQVDDKFYCPSTPQEALTLVDSEDEA